jgi:hypothetical protein
VNCDGADGIVVESFYVAPDGDDMAPGSPTRPLQTINEAIRQAFASLATPDPRPHVFVASGTYTETLELMDGVKLHGGYRRDYLALDPDGFQVVVRAPADTTAPGGAALVAREVGANDTVVEWIQVRGLDATMPSAPAFGAMIVDPGPRLSLRQMEVRAGVAGSGANGRNGTAGSPPTAAAQTGAPPRGAIEDASHTCTRGMANVVAGGLGGQSTCDGTDVSGGRGGSPSCPTFAERQPSGERGRGPSGAAGGQGGQGGQDSQGPIMGVSCSVDVCCGLADFTVPTEFTGPQAGSPGRDGTGGMAGRGCMDAFGRFVDEMWMPATATGGTAGTPGSGGGGGGAGGGAEMEWFTTVCEFADGLGGGGGGGGAGGCGGQSGRPGTSGGPSIAVVVRQTSGRTTLPTFDDVVFAPSDGGRGGDGGGGGDGGLGGAGAFGGSLPRASRSTPTLAGPFPGARGGAGGNGGSGGGGGGGCGGGSVGVWLTGAGMTEPPEASRWRSDNTFDLGRGGQAGLGGGGAAAAADGAEGGAIDVVVR